MRILFVKESLAWPRSSGHDVHGFYMMKALAELGHEVALVTAEEPVPEAVAGLPLAMRCTLEAGAGGPVAADGAAAPRLTFLQERYRSYWGVHPDRIGRVRWVADEFRADAVVAVGLTELPYLGAIDRPHRVWYAADEWAWHHLSQVRAVDPSSWGHLAQAAIKGLYERAYAPLLDRVWVVSEADRRAMLRVAGLRAIDVVPNGIDGEHYAPTEGPQLERSCIFWGRLDFGPNVQALEWFCRRIWPALWRTAPDARFTICGFKPSEPVRALATAEGVTLRPDLPDIRSEIGRHQVVVLPFISGGGIKNKLLEAASLGKAIVCTPRACSGLRLGDPPDLVVARTAGQWVAAVRTFWNDPGRRDALGRMARHWVLHHHSWAATARVAVAGLKQLPRRRHP